MGRRFGIVALAAVSALAVGGGRGGSARPAEARPRIDHLFVVVMENKDYATTFGPATPAPYLGRTLPARGALLTGYYGIGHNSLTNYVAMVSGQAPNVMTQADCQFFMDVTPPVVGPEGQAVGQGCVYPTAVKTVVDQLEANRLTWRGYMEDMGNEPLRDNGTTCAHPALNSQDRSQAADVNDKYAARHDPFVYFHSIIDRPTCRANVVPLTRLRRDLSLTRTTPNLAFISPNLCNDGHDATCVGPNVNGGREGGLVAVDFWLKKYVPVILASPAWAEGHSMLVVTFDEGELPKADACVDPCDSPPGPGSPFPGIVGPGGGRVGAVVLSPFVRPGTVTSRPYNHYSFLRTVEDLFGLRPLGFASRNYAFGSDVFTVTGQAWGQPQLPLGR